ncbi:MAG: ASKHA domain-containing protein [Oscillospiraceae bacterium]|nr:ASKHA domain-containing protein [Oscillospiraceae bacterium]
MDKITLTLLPENRQLTAEPGQTVLEVLRAAGLHPDAPCGGKGACGKCRMAINGEARLACQTAAEPGMTVVLPEAAREKILQGGIAEPITPDGEHRYALAFDIGTTTVVAYLLSGKTGAMLAEAGMLNPQAAFGADVISRIQYTLAHGPAPLREEIRGALAGLTETVTAQTGVAPMEITVAAIVGNTCMHHLFLGADVTPLTTPPYMPSVQEAMTLSAKGILPIAEEGIIRLLPNIAGFVGGDTVGCMSAVAFDTLEELTLLVDIGTNGEMVLGDRRRRISCSTAAGPAFEGAKISCGMRGAAGAIDHVAARDGALHCHILGEGVAVGLCGSGLLDAVFALLQTGRLSGSGRLTEQSVSIPLRDGVALTQKDIREVQLAKSAIRSGVELLCKQLGVRPEDVQRVCLAGAFGNYLSPESACGIGMLPPCLLPKIVPVGNAAGEGAKRCALSEAEFEHSKRLAAETEFLELASMPEFQDCFIDYLSFEEEEDGD